LDIPPPSLPTRQPSQTSNISAQPTQAPTKLQVIIPSQIINEKQSQPPLELPPPIVREKSTSGIINPPAFKKKPPVEPQPPTQITITPPPTTSSKPVKPMPEEEKKKCNNIIQSLKKHFFAGPFKNPVDVVALKIPDYLVIIKEPMDLSTVERNLRNDRYGSPNQFGADVRKIWKNAQIYNAEGSDIYKMATELSNYFEKLFKDVEQIITLPPPSQLQVRVKEPYDIDKHVKKVCKQINGLHHKGGKFTSIDFYAMKFSIVKDQPMSSEEKKSLYRNVHNLPPAYLKGVWDIINDEVPPEKKNKEVLEFDLDQLSVEIARKLERFVNYHTAQIKKSTSRRAKLAKRREDEVIY